jgi:hypothetical protein
VAVEANAAHTRGSNAGAPLDVADEAASGTLTLSVSDGRAVRVYDSQTRSITEGQDMSAPATRTAQARKGRAVTHGSGWRPAQYG